ncbi:calcium/sodium antiporter [Vallitalea pronyensis]|uniref:Calcium/sodium antiporter n=1 Tax=Vallitalea pronyensis TaxID=1348613 RepID=A0A8J8MHS4_9FIRM|nr:calcium/sodium antiporter [Vallitalea pronyensis]QUI22067.1 calcium/sodium antiporter [Vallitalea pronyensis]
MIIPILLFLIGLILIVKGGDLFIDSSINIARAYHLPEIFIGATIVSIATTAPEVIVSVTAAANGHTTMSIGNAIGSTICNTGLILGITNIIMPSTIKGKFFKIKSIVLLLFFIVISFFAYDGLITKDDSLMLIMLLLGYMMLDTFILKYKRKQTSQHNREIFCFSRKIKILLFFVIGIFSIIGGSNLLINNGVQIAEFIGVPESVISLSLIAFGTSLPELTTALTAMKKGHTSLSAGNIIGANILNITFVIGSSGLVSPLTIEKQNIFLDFPVSFLLILVLTLPCLFKSKISRIQAIILLIIYVTYITILYRLYI